VQRLIVEASLGSCLNASLLAGGACAALSSATTGDGQVHFYPSGTALDAAASRRPRVLASALPSAGGLGVGKQVIGFAESSASSHPMAREVVGLVVGEALGHGAELQAWSIGGAALQGGATTRRVFLEHSAALSGAGQQAAVAGAKNGVVPEECNFKCRATHLVGSSSGCLSGEPLLLRTLVHNAFEASHNERALIAAWDSCTGKYAPEASASLCWADAPHDQSEDAENAAPGAGAGAAAPGGNGQGRFGGVDCACLFHGHATGGGGAVLATGHARSADGIVRVSRRDRVGEPTGSCG
jgi:hypothetical protein